jgi:hypothetical protein
VTGVDALNDGPYAVSSWNLDDVAVTQTAAWNMPTDATRVLYPYAGTVFPRGLTPPVLQWQRTTPPADYVKYCLRFADPAQGGATTFRWCRIEPEALNAQYAFPPWVWRSFEATASGQSAEIVLQRMVGGVVMAPIVVPVRFAAGPARGTIYYWEANGGRIARIADQSAVVTSFLQTGTDSLGNPRCASCHSVSADGTTLVAELDGQGGAGEAFDTSTGLPTYLRNYPVGLQAITPDGAYTLWSDAPAYLSPTSSSAYGTPYLTATSAAQVGFARSVANPTFSPLGSFVAYASRTNEPRYSSSYIDYDYSELAIAGFSATLQSFSNNHVLVSPPGTAGAGTAGFGAWSVATHPTFSPDEKWVAYQLGSALRTRSNVGKLFLVGTDGTGGVELAQANGAGYLDGHDLDVSYQPTFSPTASGGYYWLVFESQRTYGNTIPRCSGAQKDCGQKQLWMSAIDASPAPGTDPSHPPIWLPGQSPTDQNMRGYFAKSACTPSGQLCSWNEECCGYDPVTPAASTAKCILAQPATLPVSRTCQAVVPNACQSDGSPCSASTDCCNYPTSACVQGTCMAPAATYAPGTFTRDFAAQCPPGAHADWTLLRWRAVTGGDSKIDFFAATAASGDALPPAPPAPTAPPAPAVALATATGQSGNWSFVDVGGALPMPPGSQDYLRVYAILSPSTGQTEAPLLIEWSMEYDCNPSE